MLLALTACSSTPVMGTDHYALMSPSMLGPMLKQCSRGAPSASGAWAPTRDQVDELEKHLPQLAEQAKRQGLPPSIGDPNASFRQYIGVIVDNHRFIYVNAIPPRDDRSSVFADARSVPAIVCDGGSAFWGVLYDPDTKTYSQLDANGAI